MQRRIAQFFSIIFHPLLMPTIGIYIIFHSDIYFNYIPDELKRVIYIIVFICTTVLPLSLMPFFIYQRIIQNIQMSRRRDRLIPLIITTVMYIFTYYLLYKLQTPEHVKLFILAAAILVLITCLISIKWKISAHMVGIGGLVGMIIALYSKMSGNLNFYLFISIFIAGLVGASRLKLNAHNSRQVYIGLVIGLIPTLLIMLFF